jgi:hypothetical protein
LQKREKGLNGLLPKQIFAGSKTLFDKSKACFSPAFSGIRFIGKKPFNDRSKMFGQQPVIF